MASTSKECGNHKVVMQSTEQIWKNPFDERYGHEPIAQCVVYVCRTCGHKHEVTFKHK